MKKIIVCLALMLTLFGCKKEEKVIDNSRSLMDLYLSDSLANDVNIYEYPSLKIKKTGILASVNITLSSPVVNIREFQKKIYLLAPQDDKMIVFDAISDTLIAVIDFPEGSQPFDIHFANPVDGYIYFKSASNIANYDLVFNKVAKNIETNSPVSSISIYKSYSYLCEKDDKSVSAFDNRTYKSDANIQLTGYPVLSTTTSENEILVLTMGASDGQTTTPAQVHFISPEDKTLRYTRALGDNIINANEIIPTDIVSTSFGYAFVPSNKGLIRLDTRNDGSLRDISKRLFSRIEYAPQIDSMLLLEPKGTSTNLVQASPITGALVDVVELPVIANCFHLSY